MLFIYIKHSDRTMRLLRQLSFFIFKAKQGSFLLCSTSNKVELAYQFFQEQMVPNSLITKWSITFIWISTLLIVLPCRKNCKSDPIYVFVFLIFGSLCKVIMLTFYTSVFYLMDTYILGIVDVLHGQNDSGMLIISIWRFLSIESSTLEVVQIVIKVRKMYNKQVRCHW